MKRLTYLLIAAVSLWLGAFSQQAPQTVGPESVWQATPEALTKARQSCAQNTPPALGRCFANAMKAAGASDEAVAFATAHDPLAYVRDFQETGIVDIAAVTWPYRANENDGLLLMNGEPREINVDDTSRLTVSDLNKDSTYAAILTAHPKAMLMPGDRSSAGLEIATLPASGQRFYVDYRIVDGCRACAVLGQARFAFDFDGRGKFTGARLTAVAPGDEEADLAPPPGALEMSGASRLIRKLYDATRSYKESEALAAIKEAQELAKDPAERKALGPQKRTALHWVVFGSAGETRPRLFAAFEELAAELIAGGVGVNDEDQYQNTALDYLDYSPNHEMQTLLLENGGVSGYFTGDLQERFVELFQKVEVASQSGQVAKLRHELAADLKPGQTFSVRLLKALGSQESWIGDPIEAVVTAPLMDGSRVLLAPGSRVEGTIFYSQTAPNKYSHPRLVLDFANIVHPSGVRSPIFVRVAAIDNARETVRKNEITGITQPHASTKASWGLRAVSFAHPGVAWAIEGARTVYGMSIRREIFFPEGTDVTLQVTGPSKLKEYPSWAGWKRLTVDPELEHIVQRSPVRAATSGGALSDLSNLMFIGSEAEVAEAFDRAGWVNADRVNVATALKTFQATIRQSGYSQAPMSTLMIEGKAPDFVFQKGLNTFAMRHHLRVWKQPGKYRGREIWISSSTHDTGIGIEKGTKWFHRIDPRIDRERNKVQTDLLFGGGATSFALVDRPRAPRQTANATGDKLLTDGKMMVLWLSDKKAVASR